MKEFRCNEDCELFKGNCGKHHIDWQGHTVWDCPHEHYYAGVIGDFPRCFQPSKEFKEKQRLNKQITIGEMESILDKIRAEIDSHCGDNRDRNDGLYIAMKIIEKYQAEVSK